MFQVNPNKEYKKHFIGYMIGTSCGVFLEIVGVVALIMLIVDKDYKSAAFIVFCLLSTAVGFFPFTLSAFHTMFDKYTFYEDGFSIKLFYGKNVKYSLNEILTCRYYPDYEMFRNLYSDTIFFVVKDKIKHEIPLYKDYIDNYEELRIWVLDNLNVQVYKNPLGELHPKYQQFIKRKSKNDYKKS